MKLSEAIRLGSMLKPQAFGTVYGPRQTSTCALGAAVDALGESYIHVANGDEFVGNGRGKGTLREGERYFRSPKEWHSFLSGEQDCPECRWRFYGMSAIGHLNDDHRWTREQIADWVESVEKAQAAQLVSSTVV